MTKKDYFRQRFASLGLSLTEADLLDLNIPDLSGEATTEEQKRASKDDIIAFYSNECKRLGLKDELSKKPKVIFR